MVGLTAFLVIIGIEAFWIVCLFVCNVCNISFGLINIVLYNPIINIDNLIDDDNILNTKNIMYYRNISNLILLVLIYVFGLQVW